GQAVGARVEGVEIGAEERAAVLVPGEGWAVMTQIVGEGGQAVRGVSEFEHLRGDEGETGLIVEVWRQDRQLLIDKEIHMGTTHLMSCHKIEREGRQAGRKCSKGGCAHIVGKQHYWQIVSDAKPREYRG